MTLFRHLVYVFVFQYNLLLTHISTIYWYILQQKFRIDNHILEERRRNGRFKLWRFSDLESDSEIHEIILKKVCPEKSKDLQ